MNQPPTPTVGTWRVLPVAPELRYVSPAAVRQRTRSGFGVASLLLGVAAAVGVALMWLNLRDLSGGDTDFVAIVAAPVCVVGFAIGVVGVVRRGKRRIHGMLGIMIHLCVALAVALLWLVTHVAA